MRAVMSDEQFKQLLEQMAELTAAVKDQGGHLGKIDARLDNMEERLIELTSRVAEIKRDTTRLQVDVRLVYRSLEAVLERQDVETNERVHLSDVANRHERWIKGLAKHADLRLSHD